LIRYGNYKRGSGKLHPHNECGVCSEKTISKKAARRMAKEDMEKATNDFYEWADEKIKITLIPEFLVVPPYLRGKTITARIKGMG